MNDAKDELFKVLDESEMRNVPVIIIANKQDVPSKYIILEENKLYDILFHL
jgi:signal recognition particle receptor subunit beta